MGACGPALHCLLEYYTFQTSAIVGGSHDIDLMLGDKTEVLCWKSRREMEEARVRVVVHVKSKPICLVL